MTDQDSGLPLGFPYLASTLAMYHTSILNVTFEMLLDL
jgi:hypothetical protein